MTTPPAPQPDPSAGTAVTPTPPTKSNDLDPPAWRLVFLIVSSMLEGTWAKFVRSTVLLLLPIAAVVLLAYLLGPTAATAFGLGSIGTASLTRHVRTKGQSPPSAGVANPKKRPH